MRALPSSKEISELNFFGENKTKQNKKHHVAFGGGGGGGLFLENKRENEKLKSSLY